MASFACSAVPRPLASIPWSLTEIEKFCFDGFQLKECRFGTEIQLKKIENGSFRHC
jgi:hypothetical protein